MVDIILLFIFSISLASWIREKIIQATTTLDGEGHPEGWA